jgi:hypothetical protein
MLHVLEKFIKWNAALSPNEEQVFQPPPNVKLDDETIQNYTDALNGSRCAANMLSLLLTTNGYSEERSFLWCCVAAYLGHPIAKDSRGYYAEIRGSRRGELDRLAARWIAVNADRIQEQRVKHFAGTKKLATLIEMSPLEQAHHNELW